MEDYVKGHREVLGVQIIVIVILRWHVGDHCCGLFRLNVRHGDWLGRHVILIMIVILRWCVGIKLILMLTIRRRFVLSLFCLKLETLSDFMKTLI